MTQMNNQVYDFENEKWVMLRPWMKFAPYIWVNNVTEDQWGNALRNSVTAEQWELLNRSKDRG